MGDKEILSAILSGKYNKCKVKSASGVEFDVNKCNLFVDDMAQKLWGVKLPRYKEAEPEAMYEGWDNRPLKTSKLNTYLAGRTIYDDGGVSMVDRYEANELANIGELVVASDGTHSTLVAPGKGPMVYRSDQTGRHGDKRLKVGVGDGMNFYHVDPTQYNEFEAKGQHGYSHETISDYGITVLRNQGRSLYGGLLARDEEGRLHH